MTSEKSVEKQSSITDAYSTHTFIWPFELSEGENSDDKFNRFIAGRGWESLSLELCDEEHEIIHENYMLHQYLSNSARKIFFQNKDKTSRICTLYQYPRELIRNYLYYIEYQGGLYQLPIDSIELHVYNHGVGLLFIRTLNTKYPHLQDVRKINDFGRRISLPFVPAKKDGFILTAEAVGIMAKDNPLDMTYVEEIRKNIEWVRNREKSVESLSNPAQFLYDLLMVNVGKIPDKKDVNYEKLKIELNTEDRMFVMGTIRNAYLSEQIANGNIEELELLYTLIYVDPNSHATCQNKAMRRQLLEKAIYTRWSDWGTIHGITNYSMFCITTDNGAVNDSVVIPFEIEYKYIISLVLAQKMGLTRFSEDAGAVVGGVEKSGEITKGQAKKLINLQERYITFKNQILILEATTQEQGIEIYQMLQKQLQVNEEQEILNEQLQGLYEVTNVSNGNRIGQWGIWLAVAAIVVDVIINVVMALLTILKII